MYLKRLDLQGFKTFAHRTELVFDAGITAIVGPNGSGKSNVADAIRWVLGEQSLRLLRSRKTEDLIFAGGGGRPPAGMTEVALTLDNTTGWLDIPYAEVAVSRRAYRSGENEYHLNGDRVRLRDVADLLSKANVSPNGYTILGQGLVDQALSQRPEERRELFADAAGIRVHAHRLADARQKLEATTANLARVSDIVAEVEPRLRVLERRARLLADHDAVEVDLRRALAQWYGHACTEAARELARAAAAQAHAEAALEAARDRARQRRRDLDDLAERESIARAALAGLEERRADADRRRDALAREAAVAQERLAAARSRLADLATERDALFETRGAESTAATEIAAARAILADRLAAADRELADADAALAGRRRSDAALRQRLADAEAEAFRLARAVTAVEGQLGQFASRLTTIDRERADQAAAATRDAARLDDTQRREDAARLALAERQEHAQAAAESVVRARQKSARLRAEFEAARATLAEHTRERQALQARLDLLDDARDGYAGYYAGVRAVLKAATPVPASPRRADGALAGIIGLAASLIRVPAAVETAIEIALGSHLQDIVVESWSHAEAAIQFLKKTSQGRATFLPLDALRAHAADNPLPGLPGVLGVGAELVSADARYRSVVLHLLGRTLVVADLEVARRSLGAISGHWQIVTVGGELVRSSGAVTGGSVGAADRAVLARERERRELPARVAAAAERATAVEREIAAARQAQREADQRASSLADELRRAESAQAAARDELATAAARRERLEREIAWSQEIGDRATAERDELLEREAAERARLDALAGERTSSEVLLASIRQELSAGDAAARDANEHLLALRARRATVAAEGTALARAADLHAHAVARVDADLAARDQRAREMSLQREQLERSQLERDDVAQALDRALADLDAEAAPLRDALRALDRDQRDRRGGEEALQSALSDLSDAARRAAIAAQVARDRLLELRHEIAHELPWEIDLAAAADIAAAWSRRDPTSNGHPSPDLLSALATEPSGGVPPLHVPWRGGQGVRPATPSPESRAPADPASPAAPSGAISPAGVLLAAAPSGTRRATAEPAHLDPTLGLEPTLAAAIPAADLAALRLDHPDVRLGAIPQPDALRRRVDQLRGRLRQMGNVDASAAEEFAAERNRHSFLTRQLADLRAGERSLRAAIVELEATMERRFAATFQAVGVAFKSFFTELFGGGTARLSLTQGEASAPGIDIVAQPPGKRAQSLALLSGGERALTAVALLFAILSVNPTPICVLDEVDAALDDANVVRFGTVLRRLSERIQFVVITHNRATMETADTLYGISMSDRATSRALSLHLTDLPTR